MMIIQILTKEDEKPHHLKTLHAIVIETIDGSNKRVNQESKTWPVAYSVNETETMKMPFYSSKH